MIMPCGPCHLQSVRATNSKKKLCIKYLVCGTCVKIVFIYWQVGNFYKKLIVVTVNKQSEVSNPPTLILKTPTMYDTCYLEYSICFLLFNVFLVFM